MDLLLRKQRAQAKIEGWEPSDWPRRRLFHCARHHRRLNLPELTHGEPNWLWSGRASLIGQQKAPELLYCIFEGDRGRISCATSSLRLPPRQCCSPLKLFPIALEPRMSGHRLTVRLLFMARSLATARLTSTMRRQATVHLPRMARCPSMPRRLITIRHGRHAQYRMPFRRCVRRAMSSGDAVPAAVHGGGSAIQRSLRDLTAAMVRHRVQPITVPIEVIWRSRDWPRLCLR